MHKRLKVLIVTAWWPTKSKYFKMFSEGVARQLDSKIAETELFITTHFHQSKYGSIVGAMNQAEQWAKEHNFTHIFNLEADMFSERNILDELLKADKDVIMAGHGTGEGMNVIDVLQPNCSWNCCLVKIGVLEVVPFSIAHVGDYSDPARMWFKRINQLGYKVWRNHNTPVKLLESSRMVPTMAFEGKEA